MRLDDPADDLDEDVWEPTRGAIFLANLDDDEDRCPSEIYPAVTPDAELAACHDAADERVNGAGDLLDLARLRAAPWTTAPAGVVASVRVDPGSEARVRLFVSRGGAFQVLPSGGTLTIDEVRGGAELGIEALDVVRGEPGGWSGIVDVTLEMRLPDAAAAPRADVVQLAVAPFVVEHHLMPVDSVLVSRMPTDPANEVFRDGLADSVGGALGAGRLEEPTLNDRWMQDFFESAWMTMPGPDGPHGMRVLLRSPNPGSGDGPVPLRVPSRVVFELRGPDVGVVQQFSLGRPRDAWTFDNLGNLEVIPPYSHDGVDYPLGRLVVGGRAPLEMDPSFRRMLDAQGVQPVVDVDTSWLFVGHVDEVVTFLPAPTERGWIMLIADPRLARTMLETARDAGHGDAVVFDGRVDRVGVPMGRTVAAILDDDAVRSASDAAATHLDAMRATLVEATGLGETEIVRVPFLFAGTDRLRAFQPGMTNLLSLSPTRVAAPDPHGPIVDGEDPFRARLEDALAAFGVSVDWLDSWAYLHLFIGEVHCGVNTLRAGGSTRWWD